MNHGWIGVDLDRTLAYYDKWRGADHVGEPIPLMLERVKKWLADGIEVRIVTARVSSDGTIECDEEVTQARRAIESWCMKHLGRYLYITCKKDFSMLEIWDDRAVQIIPNTGVRADGLDDRTSA